VDKVEVSYTVEEKDGVIVFLAWCIPPRQRWDKDMMCVGSVRSFDDAREKLIARYRTLRELPEPPAPHEVEI
jgi:hypothetical protein